jgi:SRSO17 transposase
MVARALAAGVPFGWVTGDTVYGGNPGLRGWLEQREIRYVLAVKRTEPRRTLTEAGPVKQTAEQRIAAVDPAGWLRLSAGQGAKGRRVHDWTRVRLDRDDLADGLGCWLLARRPIDAPDDPDELAFYVCVAPEATALSTLVAVAGARWTVEECFQ